MANEIIRSSLMPNVYIDNIHVNEYDDRILINLILTCVGSESDNWRASLMLPYMHINASILCGPDLSSKPLSLTTGEESNSVGSINSVLSGVELIPNTSELCVKKPANMQTSYERVEDLDYYKYRYSFTINKPEDIDLNEIHVYAWSSFDHNKFESNSRANFNFAANKNLRSPLRCEAIKRNGAIVETTNFYRVAITQELWPGPVYTDSEGTLRGGSYEGYMQEPPILEKYTKNNSKILYNDYTDKSFTRVLMRDQLTLKETIKEGNSKPQRSSRSRRPRKPQWFPQIVRQKFLKPGFNPSRFRKRKELRVSKKIPRSIMKKEVIPAIFEFGMTTDSNDDLQNIFIVDMSNVAQGKSFVGDLIFKVDPILHSQISNDLEIDDITINRSIVRPKLQSYKFAKSKNLKRRSKKFKNQIKLRNNRSMKNKENLFRNVELLHTNNTNFKLKPKIFFRKRNVIDAGLTAEKTKIASIEQLNVNLERKIRVIQFTDHEVDKLPKGEYSYSLRIKSKDKFVNFVKNLLEDVEAFRVRLFEYHQHITKNKLYDHDALKFKDKYLRSFFRSNGLEYRNRRLETTDIDTGKLKNSFFVKGCNKLNRLCQLSLIPFFNKIFLKKIIPTLASPESILHAIKEIDDIYRMVEKYYKIKPTSDGGAPVGSKNSNTKNEIVFNYRFENTHVVNPKKKIKYRYMKFPKANPLKMKKSMFKTRANREVSKYFRGKPSVRDVSLAGVSNSTINSLTNIQENSYLHFTPEEIKVGNKMIDNTSLSNNFKNNDLYNLLQVSRFVEDFESEDELETRAEKFEKIRDSLNLIDASDFLGDDSPAVLNLVNLVNLKPDKLLKDKKSLRQLSVAMASSKIQRKRTNKIDLFNIEKKDNIFMKSLKKDNFDPKKMPIQLKSLLFSRSSMAKNHIMKKNFDIFSNPLTSEMAMQNFINIKKVQYLDGFHKNANGVNILSKPVFRDLDGANYAAISGKSKLCKLVSGFDNIIFKHQSEDFDSEGEIFLLEDDNTTDMQEPTGITTVNAGHHHAYNVDENGNGFTEYAVHPENQNIKHRHEIINGVIQVAASSCYPNCNDLYGVDGVGAHLHQYIADSMQQPTYVPQTLSETDEEMTNESTELLIDSASPLINLFSSTVEITQNKNFDSIAKVVRSKKMTRSTLDIESPNFSVGSPASALSAAGNMSMGSTGGGGY